MSPEAGHFLDKAARLLAQASHDLEGGFNEGAARSAYLSALHSAQACISERDGPAARTHGGVQAKFYQLYRDHPAIDPGVLGFLSSAYNYKSVADYDVGDDAVIAPEIALAAIDTARRMLAFVTEDLRSRPG